MKIPLLSLTCVFFLLNPAFGAGPVAAPAGVPSVDAWLMAQQILEQIREPEFPDRDFAITEFGARAGEDASSAITAAIAACHAAGGGRVVVPEGTFTTGPIHLLSNVNLHLVEGSTLLFKKDPAAYLPAVYTRWEGVELYNYSPLIYAFEQENIAVTGSGTLDGQASDENWWYMKGQTEHGWREGMPRQHEARDRLFKMAEAGVPVEDRRFGDGDYLRPPFIQPYRCRNVLIEGVTLLRSSMWELNPVLCENVIVRGITVISHGPNNDGCNPESSRNVLIEDCLFDTGDDCIAIKSGRNADGRRIGVPAENIIIRNCVMKDGHGGVVIGSEISGGCRNVFVENCRMDSPNLDRAIRVKTNSIRGGLIDGIYVRNIEIGEVAEAVLKVNFHYEEGDGYGFTPILRNVLLENVVCRKTRYPVYLVGYEHSPLINITLRNCVISGAEQPSVIENVQQLHFENVIFPSSRTVNQWGEVQ
jgi:polygalacturonase